MHICKYMGMVSECRGFRINSRFEERLIRYFLHTGMYGDVLYAGRNVRVYIYTYTAIELTLFVYL